LSNLTVYIVGGASGLVVTSEVKVCKNTCQKLKKNIISCTERRAIVDAIDHKSMTQTIAIVAGGCPVNYLSRYLYEIIAYAATQSSAADYVSLHAASDPGVDDLNRLRLTPKIIQLTATATPLISKTSRRWYLRTCDLVDSSVKWGKVSPLTKFCIRHWMSLRCVWSNLNLVTSPSLPIGYSSFQLQLISFPDLGSL